MYKLLPILLFAYGLAVTTDDIYDNSYALIIGIDKYQNVKPLNYAVKDAESIQDILVNTFDFPKDNIRLLKNEDATRQNIIQALSDITTKAEDKDRVLIYFAGHGDTDDLPEGGEMGYLLPVDGDTDNLFVTSIAMDDLKRISLMSNAKHLLYLVDACYGGLLTIGARGLDSKTTPNYIEKITRNKSRQIITAGGRGEEVIEKSEWGHSAFTLNLNRGLRDGNADMNADGYITAAELGIYLNEKVTIDSENQQTPQYGRMTSQEGEFVFVYSENTVVIQDKSTDAKLDYLISEMEELKSEKSSGDDIVVEKVVNENSSWFEKYGYKRRAIGLIVLEDMYTIAYTEDFDNNWDFKVGISQIGNNSIKTITDSNSSYSLSAIFLGFSVDYKYRFNNFLAPYIFSGAGYMMTSWEDTITKLSGDKNIILFLVGGGVRVLPFQFEQPFPMDISMSIGFTGTYLPASYAVNDEIVTLEEWQIKFLPEVILFIGIPK